MLRRRVVCASLVAAFVVSAQAQDWNHWRGPKRDGSSSAFTPPARWPERPKQVWKVEAGIGHSSPVVAGNRVFQFSRVADRETLTAYETTTGKQLWREAYDAPYQMNSAATSHGKGPKSTPVIDRELIFTLGIGGIIGAHGVADGTVRWRHDLKLDQSATTG